MDVPELEKALAEADARGDKEEVMKIISAIKEIDEATKAAGMDRTVAGIRQNQAGATGPSYLKDVTKGGLAKGLGTLNFIQAAATGDPNPQGMSDLAQKKTEEFLGYEGLKPPNVVAEWVGAVPEAAADPMTYMFPGGSAIRKAAESVLPALGSKMAELGSKNQSPVVQTALQVLGGALGGLGNAQLKRLPALANTAKSIASNFGAKGAAAVDEKAGMLAEQHIRSVIKAAVEANPKLADEIVKLQAQQNVLGVDLPLSAIAENPVIKAAIATMAYKDPSFVASFTKQFDQAKNALAETASTEFGDPVKAKEAIESAMSKYAKDAPEIFDMKALREKALQGKDLEAFAASRAIAPGTNAPTTGGRVDRLLYNAPEKVSPKSVPFWQKADEVAAKEGTVLPENGVREIFQEAASATNEQKFQKFQGVFGAIKDKFSPVIDPANPRVKQWNPVSYEDYRSLQKEVSLQMRNLNPMSESYKTDMANLSQLSNAVNKAADTYFPAELADSLKKARTQYAYDSTLKDVGAKAFNDKGFLDEAKLEKWLLDPANRSAVQNLVEPTSGTLLRDPIAAAKVAVGRIMAEKDQLDSFYTRLMQQKIEDLSGMTPQQIVNKAYSDTRFTQDFLEKYGKDKATLNALRAWMLDDIVISGDSVKGAALNTVRGDKNKAPTLDRVFGFGYRARLEQLATLADKLEKNPALIKFDLKSTPKDILEMAVPGVSFPAVASRARNQIMSTQQAVIELFSKALAAKTELGYESRLKQLLLDPQKIIPYIKELETAINTQQPVNYSSALGKLIAKVQRSGLVPDVKEAGRQMTKGAYIGSKQPNQSGTEEQ